MVKMRLAVLRVMAATRAEIVSQKKDLIAQTLYDHKT
jgi:hypothetical protein